MSCNEPVEYFLNSYFILPVNYTSVEFKNQVCSGTPITVMSLVNLLYFSIIHNTWVNILFPILFVMSCLSCCFRVRKKTAQPLLRYSLLFSCASCITVSVGIGLATFQVRESIEYIMCSGGTNYNWLTVFSTAVGLTVSLCSGGIALLSVGLPILWFRSLHILRWLTTVFSIVLSILVFIAGIFFTGYVVAVNDLECLPLQEFSMDSIEFALDFTLFLLSSDALSMILICYNLYCISRYPNTLTLQFNPIDTL